MINQLLLRTAYEIKEYKKIRNILETLFYCEYSKYDKKEINEDFKNFIKKITDNSSKIIVTIQEYNFPRAIIIKFTENEDNNIEINLEQANNKNGEFDNIFNKVLFGNELISKIEEIKVIINCLKDFEIKLKE